MIRRFANVCVVFMEKYMPDPFLFATLLTAVVYLAALFLTPTGPLQLVDFWATGLWSLLVFTMQISIALVTGHALVRTKAVEKGLFNLCKLAKTPKAAYALTALLAGIASLISWAIGLIVGAFVAREMAKNVRKTHYPLLVASAYSGFVIWHMGYTSSTALLIATKGHFLEKVIGVIPVQQTMLSSWNIITALLVLISLPLIAIAMAPKEEDVVEVDPAIFDEEKTSSDEAKAKTPAEKLESVRFINLMIGAAGLIFLVRYFAAGGTLDLNIVNATFLVAGLLLSESPVQYIRMVAEGGRALGPIVIQFPFYGGIMGIMGQSGLASIVAQWFVAISTANTLPFWSLISGGIINVFIPSGGGQWSIQGPIMMEAAMKLGADPARVAMGVAWGDQWTNMIQPFWALPALAIAGLKARDIMGYCVVTFIVSGVLFALGMLVIP